MIIFEKIAYKNFLSTGDKETVIPLNECFTTLVVGVNGGGKSTMLDALSFALFNKAHRKINRPQLVNSINNKKCLVTVDFSMNGDSYKIVRGIKPNVFEIWKNNKLLNQDSNSRDYQKLLETNILKLNHKSFHQVVVLGARNFIPFMQLPTYQRREVIEDILDITMFTKMNVVMKERYSRLKDIIKDIEHEMRITDEKIVLSKKHLNELKSINDESLKATQVEIKSMLDSIEKIENENERLSQRYAAEFAIIKREFKRYQKDLDKLTKYDHTIQYKIDSLHADVKFYETSASCSKCGQDMNDAVRSTHIHECKTRASELDNGHQKLKAEVARIKNMMDDLNKTLNDISKIPSIIASNNKAIDNNNKRIRTLESSRRSNGNLDAAQKQLDELYEMKRDFAESRLSKIEERTYADIIIELLKDSGIKTKIIKQYLPVMNKLVNQYLQILDFFVHFNLDENFNETIKSRHRDDFSYASFSEGEKARIDLALLFAWRAVAKMKNSANTNLLILDETFDGSLDADGVDNLIQILNTLGEDIRVFVISHKHDLLEGKFERRLEFEKVKNFSRLKK
jgi:DNA repair exonuclease SbcCD ATPase subunit